MEKQTPIFIVCMGNPWGWNETILKIFYERDNAQQWIEDQNYSFIFAPYVYIKDEVVTSIVTDEQDVVEPIAKEMMEDVPPPEIVKDPEPAPPEDDNTWFDDTVELVKGFVTDPEKK